MKFTRVKITSTPEGEAPREIREKWIGLKLNGAVYKPGMITGEAPKSSPGFITLIKTALQSLAYHNKEAYKWWLNWQDKHPDSDAFLFESSCYEVVDIKQENRAFFRAFRGDGTTGLSPLEELVNFVFKDY